MNSLGDTGISTSDETPHAAQRWSFDDVRAKYRETEGEFFFSGIQAMVRVPFDVLRADRREGKHTAGFISGYPGSPVGTFDIEVSRQLDLAKELDITFAPGVNEELALTSVLGSQLVATFPSAKFEGVLGVWYGKAPGLDRANDALRHATFAGTTRYGGAIAVVGDDPAAKSSTLPSSSEHTLHNLRVPTFVPGNVQEVIDLGLHAAAMSRASGLWSAMRLVTAVADATGTAHVAPDRIVPIMPTVERNGRTWRGAPKTGHMAYQSTEAEREIIETRLVLAGQYLASNTGINKITVDARDAWLGIVAAGRTFYEVVEALRTLGLERHDLERHGIRLLRLGVVSPLDAGALRQFASGLEEVLVVEDGGPFLEVFLKDALYGMTGAPRVVGRRDEVGEALIPGFGSHVAGTLAAPIARRLRRRIPPDQLAEPAPERRRIAVSQTSANEVPARAAHFCSGCPHNTSTKVPDDSLVAAGIGCHGMIAFMEPERVGEVVGITQMGGEGAQWIGIEPFVEADHLFQNLGDGTLFHSGSLAIRAAVAAGCHLTYKILYNSAVGMTGGQSARGALPVPALAGELLLEGVARVIITTDDPAKYRRSRRKRTGLPRGVDVWDRSRIVEAQEVLRKVPGVTVLIHDQWCAAEARRNRKRGRAADPPRRVVINERVCEGCGDCGDVSNCLSVQPVETEFGRKTRIDQSSCNKDYSCLQGDCPSFVTIEPKAARRFLRTRRERTATSRSTALATPRDRPLDPGSLPEPSRVVPADEVTVRMPGIGGTGVLTAAQILGTAAVLDGFHVQGLDQTGFSQKAGAVVSDLRISRHPVDGTNQLTEGSVDLYLVFDLLVALADKNLAGADAERTVAVVSTSPTPTGKMVVDVGERYPDANSMVEQLRRSTRHEHAVAFDSVELATRLFGGSTTANIMVVGAAYQNGCLPISAEAIEHAIELNGAAVEANKLAFRWGRLLVHDPARVEDATRPLDGATRADPALVARLGDLASGELGRLLAIRVPELERYQGRPYSDGYLDLVRLVATAEGAADPGSTRLAEAVAASFFKLLAYKDEYEVARLHTAHTGEAIAAHTAGQAVKVMYHLHPPMLRALGMKSKLELGPWAGSVLKVLAKGKRLRGTPFDVFGYARVRRVERRLVDEYRRVVEAVAATLTRETLDAAVELAGLPDMIRGYENIKLANVDRYNARLAELRAGLGV